MSFKHQNYAKHLSRNSELNLTASESCVLFAIGDITFGDASVCVVSHNRLASLANVGISTVKRALTTLARLNIISTTHAPGGNTKIHFNVPANYNEYDETQVGEPAEHLSPEEKLQAARELHTKLTGEPWYAPCESEEEYNRLFAEFAAMTPAERFARLRADVRAVANDLPYDPRTRVDGMETPADRYKFDPEAQ